MGMANPRFTKAMQEMQENPEAAQRKYKDDEAVQDFFKEFMGLMGDHMMNMGQRQKEGLAERKEAERAAEKQRKAAMEKLKQDEPDGRSGSRKQRARRVAQDPPRRLEECQNPAVLQRYMHDQEMARKFRPHAKAWSHTISALMVQVVFFGNRTIAGSNGLEEQEEQEEEQEHVRIEHAIVVTVHY